MNGELIIYFLIAAMVFLGFGARLLTASGAFAAFAVGCLTVLGLGLKGLLILALFFASSSFWSKIKSAKEARSLLMLDAITGGVIMAVLRHYQVRSILQQMTVFGS